MPTRSLNKVLLIGNLTRDPNLRFTPNGTAVCSFGLATNRSWTPQDGGDKQERVEFHSVVAWGKLAQICGDLLHKGDKVYVEGRLQTRSWKGEDNQERKVTEVVIDNMILLRSSQGGNGGNYSNDDYSDQDGDSSAPETSEAAPTENVADVEDISDDIPF